MSIQFAQPTLLVGRKAIKKRFIRKKKKKQKQKKKSVALIFFAIISKV